ncbi:MAG TPA: hypothetical protein VFK30_01685, partial [Anaerolineae bacterium]|nr:hypothetical protein [Anaerolineae bacterium]
TPLPTLLLGLIGLASILKQRSMRQTTVAWLPPALAMAAALFSPLAIGYRHILPVLPFVIILAGQVTNLKWQVTIGNFNRRLHFGLISLLIAWLVIGTLSIFPHHLSYFNELVGGPAHADQVLADSNLDWGQDLPALKEWMAENKVDRVNLAYFGTALPAAYGINYWPLPAFLHFIIGPEVDSYNPYTPEPGWYAISATSLRLGLVYRDQNLYAYFRDKTPDARAGYSILLYKVDYPAGTVIDRAVVIGAPRYSFPAKDIGYTPEHRLIAKWSDNPDSIIFAMNGSARYFLGNRFPFGKELHDALTLAGHMDKNALIVDARPVIEARRSQWQSDTLHLADNTSLPWPIDFDGKMELIGVDLKAIAISRGG